MINDNIAVTTDNNLIVGNKDNNSLVGTTLDDVIYGLSGDDTLNGDSGNDSLYGGNGNNTLYGGAGNDTLSNISGYVDGNSGNDILIADYSNYEASINNINWHTRIKRNDTDTTILTSYGIESYQIIGTAFNDSLQGSANDTLDGGAGIDELSVNFSTETKPIAIDLTSTENQITFDNTEIRNFETIDFLYGGSNSDLIQLGLVASTSEGYVGGGYGDDTLIVDYSGYEAAIQNIESYRYIERVDNDVDLINFYQIEQYQITGTEYNDSLQGSSNSDTLIGGDGDDDIRGNSNDSLDGGAGIDRLSVNFSTETEPIAIDLTITENQIDFENTKVKNFETIDYIYGGSNSDLIKLGLTASISEGYVGGGYGDDTLIVDYSGYETAIQNIESYRYIERVDNDIDLIEFYQIEQYQITGTEYNDSLQGSGNSDTLIGGEGNDDIRGNNNDSLDGGAGIDRLSLDFSMETQSITIDLTTADNQVSIENTNVENFETIDFIYGGSNKDSIILGLAASTSEGYVGGGYGNDTLILDYSGYETAIQNISSSSRAKRVDNNVDLIVYYDFEQYQIAGTEYNDSLQGSSNSDTLIGGSGNDSLRGNSGEDVLTGVNPKLENSGVGEIDTLVGGANSDIFVLGDAYQTYYDDEDSRSRGIEDYALIKDFDLNEDIIELSGAKENYRLSFSPIRDITGIAIYKIERNRIDNHSGTNELIAIIEDITSLPNINSSRFRSVASAVEEEIEEVFEPTPEPELVEEEIIDTPENTEENNLFQLDPYQISSLAVGISTNIENLTQAEINAIADINQDGFISAFDAYLAYTAINEI